MAELARRSRGLSNADGRSELDADPGRRRAGRNGTWPELGLWASGSGVGGQD
jgi:hypothetical protein